MSLDEYLSELGDDNKSIASNKLDNLSSLSKDDLKSFMHVYNSMRTERRRQIVGMLVELAEKKVELDFDDILFGCLDDVDPDVRIGAIEGLWECERHLFIDRLIEMLERDSQESVRAAAAQALGKFALMAELGKLGRHYAEKVERALFAAIANAGEAPEVRRRSIEAIACLSKPDIVQIIREAYRSGDRNMRVSAIYAMGRNCDPGWLEVLIEELSSPDAEMRYEAAGACGQIGGEVVVTHLVKLINDDDMQVRLSAIAAIGAIGGDESEAALKDCLHNSDEGISRAADDALNELNLMKDPFKFKL